MIRTAPKALRKSLVKRYGEENVLIAEMTQDKPRRGRPPTGDAKKLLTLRLDVDVIEKFRATGPGWQVRMAEVLAAAVV